MDIDTVSLVILIDQPVDVDQLDLLEDAPFSVARVDCQSPMRAVIRISSWTVNDNGKGVRCHFLGVQNELVIHIRSAAIPNLLMTCVFELDEGSRERAMRLEYVLKENAPSSQLDISMYQGASLSADRRIRLRSFA